MIGVTLKESPHVVEHYHRVIPTHITKTELHLNTDTKTNDYSNNLELPTLDNEFLRDTGMQAFAIATLRNIEQIIVSRTTDGQIIVSPFSGPIYKLQIIMNFNLLHFVCAYFTADIIASQLTSV